MEYCIDLAHMYFIFIKNISDNKRGSEWCSGTAYLAAYFPAADAKEESKDVAQTEERGDKPKI